MIMVVNPSVPVHTLQEFIAMAKAKPGSLNYASPGNGSPANLAGELLKNMAHIDVLHVPYKGAGPATNDLLGGRVQMTFSSQVVILPFIKSGKVRAIAGTTERRSPALPDVPTMAESGLPGYSLTSWQAVVAPGKTPPEIAERLNKAVVACLNEPTVRHNLIQQGLEVTPSSQKEAQTFVDSEIKRFAALVKDMGIRAD
jgi:tripartite-type tricarboxylate transporter receptor subunit TctC